MRGLASGDTIYSFYSEQKPLAHIMRELPTGAHLIPAHMELFKIDSLYGRNPNITSALKNGLTQELLPDEMIPVSADCLSLQGVNRLDAVLKVLEKPLGKRIERRIVITRFDSRRRLSYEIFDKLREHYGKDLCETRISETASLAESPAHVKDVFSFAPHGQGARDYNALADELIGSGFFDPPR